MHFIPGLRLRAPEESEILGIDDAEMGEFAYDYVGLETEIGHSVETMKEKGDTMSSRTDSQQQHA
jgi:Amt family ammonium transporter